jgi:hypothetical protein
MQEQQRLTLVHSLYDGIHPNPAASNFRAVQVNQWMVLSGGY